MKLALSCVLVLAVLSGCGVGESEMAAKPTSTPTSTPTPAPTPYSAFDKWILSDVRQEIKDQVHAIAAENDGGEESLTVRCVPDTERTFTCVSHTKLRFDGGFCADLTGNYRGSVDPKTGDYDWTSTGTEGDSDPYAC